MTKIAKWNRTIIGGSAVAAASFLCVFSDDIVHTVVESVRELLHLVF
jgi:hypothetical protein